MNRIIHRAASTALSYAYGRMYGASFVARGPGVLWTPGYWGVAGGVFLWHGGYWGPRVGYYGGTGGVQAEPAAAESAAALDGHLPPTPAQRQQVDAARANTALRAGINHGVAPSASSSAATSGPNFGGFASMVGLMPRSVSARLQTGPIDAMMRPFIRSPS